MPGSDHPESGSPVSAVVSDPTWARCERALVRTACCAAVASAAVLSALGSDAFEQVLGVRHPTLTTLAVVLLGYGAWSIIVRRGWIASGVEGRAGFGVALCIGAALTLPVVLVDLLGGFPADINAPAPDALLFYPSVALMAELVFHAAPLACGALLAGVWPRVAGPVWLVALASGLAVEPALQVIWGLSESPTWANIFVGVQLLVFNGIGLWVLRRYGFLRVFAYRLSYYAIWHMAWGHVRIDVLFGG